MIFKILDRDENYIKNIEGVDYEYSWTLNGVESLSFTTYESGLEPLYRILYQDPKGEWIEFIITEPVDEHTTTDGVVYSVYAVNSFYETNGDWLEDKRPQNTTALQALETALSPSRWEVGKVDDLGLNSTNFYRESTRSAVLEKIVPTWKAELETKITVKDNKITSRTVNLHKQIGSFWGKRFVFKKDMDKIKRTINTDDFCTALYGFGKGEQIEGTNGYGRRIDFAEVNNGKSYVENLEAKELFGRNSQNGKQHIFGKVEFDQCEDKKELLELTLAELEKRSKFNVTYECDVIDLGIEFESVNKGDTVIVKDNDLGICISARIFEYKEKDNGKIHIKLGNYQPLMVDELNKSKDFLDQFRSKQGVWDRSGMLSENGLDGSMVDNLIKALNEELNGTGGYVYLSDDGKGLVTYDKPIDKNPTKAIQILGGSFRMANEKLANGEWNWRTIGTGDGLYGSEIVANSITANKLASDVGQSLDLSSNVAITSKVSQDSYDEYKQSVSSRFSTIEQNADKIELSVASKTDSSDIKNIFSSMTLTDTQIKSVTDNFTIESRSGTYRNEMKEGNFTSYKDGYKQFEVNQYGLEMYEHGRQVFELTTSVWAANGSKSFRLGHKDSSMLISYYNAAADAFSPYITFDKYNTSGVLGKSDYPIRISQNVEMMGNFWLNGYKLWIGDTYYLQRGLLSNDEALYITRDNANNGLIVNSKGLYFFSGNKTHVIFQI